MVNYNILSVISTYRIRNNKSEIKCITQARAKVNTPHANEMLRNVCHEWILNATCVIRVTENNGFSLMVKWNTPNNWCHSRFATINNYTDVYNYTAHSSQLTHTVFTTCRKSFHIYSMAYTLLSIMFALFRVLFLRIIFVSPFSMGVSDTFISPFENLSQALNK